MAKIDNGINTAVRTDGQGFTGVIDEDTNGNHAIPVALVTKNGEDVFEYLSGLGGSGGEGGGVTQEDLDYLAELVSALSGKVASLEDQVTKVGADNATLTDDVTSLKEANTVMLARIEALEAKE